MQELMKKIVYAIAALALIFTGCAKELDNSTKDNFSKVRLHVKVADQLTKVSADNDGRYHWQAGDKISVLNDAGKAFEFETEEGGNDVDFSGTISTGNLGSYAMYPSVSTNESVGDVVSFHLPTTIEWVANATNMPMLGKIDENKATFRSVGGVLKLVCYNIPSGAAWLQFTATNKQIVGEFMIDGSESLPVLEATNTDKAGEKELSIDFSSDYSANKVFYIPLPTGTIDGFTVAILDDELNELFSRTATVNLNVERNQMIIAPSLNCDPTIVLWRESFTNYANATTWESATSMNVGGDYDAEKFGDATITYLTAGTTSVRTGTNAGGTTPELSFDKSTPNTFTVAGIPTNGANSMLLSFNASADCIEVSSPTDGVSVTGLSYNSTDKLYTATVSNSSAANLTLTFNSTDGSNFQRIDNPKLIINGSSINVPTITSANVNLTIGIGQLSKSTSVGITDPVDDLGLSYVLSKKDDKPMDWISSVVISEGTLTVTATDANGEAEDREAILTLKATGAADKVINLKQTSALVQKPASITTLPGNASMSASWTKAEHATGYIAYLCESTGLADPTGGIELTPSIDGSTVSVSKPSGLTNGTTYYLYVKVNTVDTNYIADSEWTEESVTPENVIYYTKITSVGDIETGVKYLIVYETGNVAFNGGIASSSYDVTNNKIAVSITDSKIVANSSTNAASFTIDGTTGAYTIKSAAGYYIGRTSTSTGVNADNKLSYPHSITFSESNVVITDSESGSDMRIRYNDSDGQNRFRYYSSNSVKAIQLYKYQDPRTPAGLTWKKSDVESDADGATIITGPDTMPEIVLDNPHGLTVSFTSSDPTVAEVISSSSETSISTGAVTSLLKAGSTTITASFPDGDATYRPATVRYTLTVTDSRMTPIITLDTSDENRTDSDYAGFTGRTATVSPSVPLVYSKTDASGIIDEFNTSTGELTLSGNTGSATVTVSFAGNSEYLSATSKSYTIKVSSTSGPEPLSAPASPSITILTSTSFTATWTVAANASGYSWKLTSTDDSSADAIASGDVDGGSTATVTKTGLDLTEGQAYYFFIKSKGDGELYADSNYSNSVNKKYLVSTLTFTKACGGSGTADDSVSWTVTSDASESSFDGTKGVHYGTGSAAVSYVNLSTSGISGTIVGITVNASGASGTSAKLNVTVGESAFGSQQSLTSTATAYSLSGSASGTIMVALTQNSAKKAIYCKSIAVTYNVSLP